MTGTEYLLSRDSQNDIINDNRLLLQNFYGIKVGSYATVNFSLENTV